MEKYQKQSYWKNLEIPVLSNHPKGLKVSCQRYFCFSILTMTLYRMAKLQNLPKQPSTHKQIQTVVHKHNEITTMKYYSAFQQEELLPSTSYMELKNIMISEVSMAQEKQIQISASHLYIGSKVIEHRHIVSRGWGQRMGTSWPLGTRTQIPPVGRKALGDLLHN